MKNDISQPDFCQILLDFSGKPDSGSEKPDTQPRNFKNMFGSRWLLHENFTQIGQIIPLNPGFSGFPEKPDPGSGIFLAQNPVMTKTKLKKKVSQIGSAISELLSNTQTDIQTYRQEPFLLCSIDRNKDLYTKAKSFSQITFQTNSGFATTKLKCL